MALEIKVGHRYRARSGDVVEVIQYLPGYVFCFVGRFSDGHRVTYNKRGWNSQLLSCWEITEELPADVAAP